MSSPNNFESTEDDLKTGISGLGDLGNASLESIENNIENAETVAAMDIDEAALRELKQDYGYIETFTDFEEIINKQKLDSVVITTPHSVHYDQAKIALESGKNTFIEKPFTIEPGHAAELADLADKKDLKLGVGVQKRNQHYGEIKNMIDSGEVGEIQNISASLEQDWLNSVEGWRKASDLSGGGNLMDSGYHLVDGVLYATGASPEKVDADIKWSDIEGIETDANLDVVLSSETGNEVNADIFVSGECSGPYEWREEVMFEGSKADVKWVHTVYTNGRDEEKRLEVLEEGESIEVYVPEVDGTTAKLEDFFNAIENDFDPIADGYGSIDQVSLIHSAYESGETGEPVDIETDPRALIDQTY